MGEQGEPFTTGDKEHEKDYKGGVKGFIALGLSSVMFVALAFINVAAGWIDNDLANAFMLVLSSLSILSFIHQYYAKHKLKSMTLIDNCFRHLEGYFGANPTNDPEIYEQYKNMVHFILPPQPNNLEILKFQNSYFIKSTEAECQDTNAEYENIERIKKSLANLKALVIKSIVKLTSVSITFNASERFFFKLSLSRLFVKVSLPP